MTTKEDIRQWLNEGKEEGATHTMIVCDTFDWDDYPVHIMPGENAREKFKNYDGNNMQKVMEVYNLSKDIEQQLNEEKSFNF